MIQVKQHNANHGADPFGGWPVRTLLEAGDIPIAQIAELALREGQSSNPLYRVHRWFARRVGSQFRSILTALTLLPDKADAFWDTYLGKTTVHGAVVLDPFIGGGTSLVESMRCNARVIGFDIDPVATFITRFELTASRMEDHYPEIKQICNEVAQLVTPLHRTMVDGVERDVLHHFWVQVKPCSNCQSDVELHPQRLAEKDHQDSEPAAEWFDLLVIDEASQVQVAVAAAYFLLLKLNGHVVLAGDDRQLGPIYSFQIKDSVQGLFDCIFS